MIDVYTCAVSEMESLESLSNSSHLHRACSCLCAVETKKIVITGVAPKASSLSFDNKTKV